MNTERYYEKRRIALPERTVYVNKLETTLGPEVAVFLDMQLRLTMLSFSNFGNVRHPEADKVTAAMNIVRCRRPDLAIDGEMQSDSLELIDQRNVGLGDHSSGPRRKRCLFPTLIEKQAK